MDLRHYLRVLRKHLVLIAAATLLCVAGALVTSLGTTPVYEGAAKLLIVPKTDPACSIGCTWRCWTCWVSTAGWTGRGLVWTP
jgi:hypothetical protein